MYQLVKAMSSSEKFSLKWNDYQANISSSFSQMRKDQDFSDITLTCDGDQQIEAHKVVLAASSPFFNQLLKRNKHPHPLLYMRGMNTSQLNSVVDFIYQGEVKIYQEDLDAFLALAEELDLKGLNKPMEDDSLYDNRTPPVRVSKHTQYPIQHFPEKNTVKMEDNFVTTNWEQPETISEESFD